MQFHYCVWNLASNYAYRKIRTEIHPQFYRRKVQQAAANNKDPGSKRAINTATVMASTSPCPPEGRLAPSALPLVAKHV
jgi:hypothetical protein